MPERDKHGNVVMICSLADPDVNKFIHNEAVKTWFMMQDVFFLENGTTPGFVILADSKNFSLGHLAKIHISTIKKYCMYTQVYHFVSLIFTLKHTPRSYNILNVIKYIPFFLVNLTQAL
jgi:hypothetical protein